MSKADSHAVMQLLTQICTTLFDLNDAMRYFLYPGKTAMRKAFICLFSKTRVKG